MSLCISLMDKDKIYMSADSATSTIVNGEIIRVDNNAKKIYDIENYIVFCCGRLDKIKEILNEININKLENIENYLLQNCNEKHNGFFDFELLVYDKENKVLNTYSQYNNFKNVVFKHPDDGVQIITSGYKTNEAFELAKKNIQDGKDVFDIFKNTYTELICAGIGGNVQIFSNKEHMMMFPLIDQTKGMNVDGLPLYYINGETICGKLILGQQLSAMSESGIVNINGNLISIYNKQGKLKVALGEYRTGVYGLCVYDEKNNKVIIDENGILQTWSDSRADNVDNEHPLIIRMFVPENVSSIYKAILRFSLEKFRAYSKGADSETINIQSTNSETIKLNSTNSETIKLNSTNSESFRAESTGGGECIFTTLSAEAEQWQYGNDGHNHGISDGTELAIFGGHETVKIGENSISIPKYSGCVTWVASGQHKHAITIEQREHKHSFTVPSHSHSITMPSHSHSITMPSHSHGISMPIHSHKIVYGIYEDYKYPSNCYVWINGSLKYGAFSSNQSGLDITPFLKTGTWNEIKITSTSLGRIDATVFLQCLCTSC